MHYEPGAKPIHYAELPGVERLLRFVFDDAAPATRPIPTGATD